jgi:hypothetical protein
VVACAQVAGYHGITAQRMDGGVLGQSSWGIIDLHANDEGRGLLIPMIARWELSRSVLEYGLQDVHREYYERMRRNSAGTANRKSG